VLIAMKCNAIFDGYYNALSGSPEFFKFIGVKNFTSLLKNAHEDDISNLKNTFENVKKDESSYLYIRLKSNSGIFEWFFIEFRLIRDGNADIKSVRADICTMDELKNSYIKKDLSKLEYRTLLDIFGEIYFDYSLETKIIKFYWINKSQNIYIYNGSFSEWKKYMIENKYIKNKNISVFEKLCLDIQGGKQKFCYEIRDSKIYADSESNYNVFKGGAVCYNGKIYKVVGSLVADRGNSESEIIKTNRDALTGLLNKEFIIKYATDILNQKPDFFVNIVIIDVDNFKLINDYFGHLFGDEIIKSVADTLDEIVNDRGIIGRFGGDEFVIVFSGFNDNMELRSYLKSIRMTVEQKFKNIGSKIDLTVSIGTAKYPVDGKTYDELFEKADTCLYIAKEKGKNRYLICDEVANIERYEKNDRKNFMAIETREKSAQFLCGIMDLFLRKRKEGILEGIKIIGEDRNLTRVAVFFGKNLERIAVWGNDILAYDNAMYIYKGSYLTNFNSNGVFVIHSSASIESKNPEVYSDFSAQVIYSAVQCIIYDDKGKIIGFVSFEKSFQRNGWTEMEIYNFTIIAHLIKEAMIDCV